MAAKKKKKKRSSRRGGSSRRGSRRSGNTMAMHDRNLFVQKVAMVTPTGHKVWDFLWPDPKAASLETAHRKGREYGGEYRIMEGLGQRWALRVWPLPSVRVSWPTMDSGAPA